MKKISTLIIYCLFTIITQAQERIISGRLTSADDGEPLPGVNVVVKGTKTGTVTDADGYYSINVSVGQTLVFSFIGLQTREVIVTENNLQPVRRPSDPARDSRKKNLKSAFLPRSLYQDSTSTIAPGVGVLTAQSPTYNLGQRSLDVHAIRRIRRGSRQYDIRFEDPTRRNGYGLQFISTIGLDQINKLPRLQTAFAQGQPNNSALQWNGADAQEIFSWGPLVRTLEFNGEVYPFDQNGRLVTSGNGTGKKANRYDAGTFFRNGIMNASQLMWALPTRKHGTLLFDLENRSRTGIIPHSTYTKQNLSINLKDLRPVDRLRASATLQYNRSGGELLGRGANLTSIVGSVLRSPVTFDNSNSMSRSAALQSQAAYQLSDQTVRSHAPGLSDNPYGLVNVLPDNDRYRRLLATTTLDYRSEETFSLHVNATADYQENRSIFGGPAGYSGYGNGRLTDRNEQQSFGSLNVTPTFRFYKYYDDQFKVSVSYQGDYYGRALTRKDGYGFASNAPLAMASADSVVSLARTLSRTTHQVVFNALLEHNDWLVARIISRNYFSNTLDTRRYTNFFPAASVSINLASLLYMGSIYDFKLYGTASRTLREAPLINSSWSYNSTTMPVEDYAQFYESSELFYTRDLAPETENKFETGLRIAASGYFNGDAGYYRNVTSNLVVPVRDGPGFRLQNAAQVKNSGVTLQAGFAKNLRLGSVGSELRWTKYNSLVTALYTGESHVALAGFSTAQVVLADGKPAGAIYGTTFLRNSDGETIIGGDGFPLEDAGLKMIGNPIPDWVLGWSSHLRLRRFMFSGVIDFQKGGDRWNGTNAVLDYLGRSISTGKNRNTSNFVFEGVDANGDPNVIPVDFYDPAQPLSQNRWVRYGWDGVGEAYIEDASALRLSEATVSYTSRHRPNSRLAIESVKIALIGRNLFLITPYSGVDPAATLFGYSFANGLDLFNTPSVRSYSIQVTVKI